MFSSDLMIATANGQTISAPAQQQTATVQVTAQPQQQNVRQDGGIKGMIPIFIIFAVMIFFMIRSQKKQQKKRQEMVNRMAKDAKVVLGGGVFGKIAEVKEATCMVEIASGVVVEVDKNGVNLIDEPAPAAPEKK